MSAQVAFLEHVPLFAGLDEPALAVLIGDLVPRKYARNDAIFHQGDHNHDLYIVLEGRVRIVGVGPSGDETTLNVYARGDTIGEFAALDDQPRSATARALTDCTLLEMAQDHFLRRMRELPDLALGVCRLLVGKLRWTTAYAETIARFDAAGRLLHILLLYTERFGREIEAGKRYELDLGMSQAGLASLVGVRRESVNRLLARWRERGLIEYTGGQVVILDLPAVVEERDRRIEAYCDNTEW